MLKKNNKTKGISCSNYLLIISFVLSPFFSIGSTLEPTLENIQKYVIGENKKEGLCFRCHHSKNAKTRLDFKVLGQEPSQNLIHKICNEVWELRMPTDLTYNEWDIEIKDLFDHWCNSNGNLINGERFPH